MSFIKKFLTPVSEKIISEAIEPVRLPESVNLHSSEPCDSSEPYNTPDCSLKIAEDQDVIKPVDDQQSNAIESKSQQPKSTTVRAFFSEKGIDISTSTCKTASPPVDNLAFSIAVNYPLTKHFIRFLRENITKKSFDFNYILSSFSQENKDAIVSLAEKLNEYGLISNLFYNKATTSLRGTVSSAPRCINFLNGDFMELYAKCVTVGVVKSFAEAHELDYKVYTNAEININSQKHELDIVFRIGDQVFWSEIKSGKFNPDEYRKLGIEMSVVPDKLIVLAADKSNDAVAAISYFYEFYCSNIRTFKSELTKMINSAFNKEEI